MPEMTLTLAVGIDGLLRDERRHGRQSANHRTEANEEMKPAATEPRT